MSDPRKASGRTARVILTEKDFYTIGRALGALDQFVIDGRERVVTREEVHRLWSRIKEAEKNLAQ